MLHNSYIFDFQILINTTILGEGVVVEAFLKFSERCSFWSVKLTGFLNFLDELVYCYILLIFLFNYLKMKSNSNVTNGCNSKKNILNCYKLLQTVTRHSYMIVTGLNSS